MPPFKEVPMEVEAANTTLALEDSAVVGGEVVLPARAVVG